MISDKKSKYPFAIANTDCSENSGTHYLTENLKLTSFSSILLDLMA